MTYQALYEQAKKGEIIIVDVRTKEEYEMGHIPGAKLCDVQTLHEDAPNVLVDQNKTYYVYCQTGYRSQIAVMQLEMMGYSDVNDMGGINNWPFEIEQ